MSIKVFTKGNFSHIIFKDTILDFEIEGFEKALNESIAYYEISFLNLKSIPKKMIDILYEISLLKQTNLSIFTSHPRLSRYLSSLGFRNSIIQSHNIDTHNNKIEYKALKIITIGGSADSLSKIIDIVTHIPLAEISIFIVQHVQEDSEPMLDKILKDKTKYDVLYPKENTLVECGKIYIAPPSFHMRVVDGKIVLDKSDKVNYARPSLSVLFDSVGNFYKSQNITVLTCGYGNDGSDSLRSLRENGSTVILTDPNECEAKDMITNAIATTEYNYIFTTGETRSFFNTLLQTVVDKNQLLTNFLKEIKKIYGYDFTKYDRGSVTRRIESFMQKFGFNSYQILIKEVLTRRYLFDELLLNLSINVTEFFRKPSSYVAMRDILKNEFSCDEMVKIWVAGSSTGEEPYSIAMVLDALNMYKHSLIYATDFNPIVIDEANNGVYPKETISESMKNSDEVLLKSSFLNYFDDKGTYYSVKKYLKKNVLFFTHNLVTDKSFNQFNIISCKNVLIYFTPMLQEIVLELFYDSLYDDGYLLLGESESMLPSFKKKFRAVNVENKVYQKVS